MCDLHRDQVRGLFRDIFVRWIVSVRDLLVHHDPSVTLRADQSMSPPHGTGSEEGIQGEGRSVRRGEGDAQDPRGPFHPLSNAAGTK